MAVVVVKKYNPGFLSADELVAMFCVRTAEYASLIEALRQCSGNANIHQLVIGPRGSGKTSLLLRVAAEAMRDTDLSARFFPVLFAEESYEVSTVGEFWLECVSRLADQAPQQEGGVDLQRTFEELRTINDDLTLGDRCLGVLQDFADRERKRLVLIVENLNMLFRDISDADVGWKLRKVLQTEPRIALLGSATSRFDQINDPKEALYETFRVIQLYPLDSEECATLWRTMSGRTQTPQTIQALRILTGGSPRLLTIVARFGANLSFRELMTDLLDLIDDHTEYFKSHLDALPAQERKVYLALADLWKPATAREVAVRARLEISKCSAQLARLVGRGTVEVSGGSARRKLYYVTERLYNIYYLMRRARGPTPLVDALIRFMEAYYSTEELKAFSASIAHDSMEVDGGALEICRLAFQRLVRLPSLEAHRAELLSLAPPAFGHASSEFSSVTKALPTTRDLLKKAQILVERGQLKEAVATWDETVRMFGERDSAAHIEALINKGKALGRLGRADEAFAVWDDAVRRFGLSEGAEQSLAVATALSDKGGMLCTLNRHAEALSAWSEVFCRTRDKRGLEFETLAVNALAGESVALHSLNRHREALKKCDEILERFDKNELPDFHHAVAVALVGRGHALFALNCMDEAKKAWDTAVKRFCGADSIRIAEQVAVARANIGAVLLQSHRLEEALAAFEGVLQDYRAGESLVLREVKARCLVNKGNALAALKRNTEAISAWEEAIRSFDACGSLDVAEPYCASLMNMAAAFVHESRQDKALELLSDVVKRFGDDDRPEILAMVADAQTFRCDFLEQAGRYEESIAIWQGVEERFGNSNESKWVELVANSFLQRCVNLFKLDKTEEALTICHKAEDRFEGNKSPKVVDAFARILVNKGIILSVSNRNEEALTVWDDIERRFGNSDNPAVTKQVVAAKASKGVTLARMNRREDAVQVWDVVLKRFGESGESAYEEEIVRASLNRILVLGLLERPEEALEACDELLRRLGDSDNPVSIEEVARTLVYRGEFLCALDRSEEGFAVWDEVAQRFEASDVQGLRAFAELALCRRAQQELSAGSARTAIAHLDRALSQAVTRNPNDRLQCHLIRARAHSAEGNSEEFSEDVEVALAILSELPVLQREVLVSLVDLSKAVGPKRMCDLIKSSPADDLLLPLRTALERMLGIEPRVAREVAEIAEDIRTEFFVGHEKKERLQGA